jgi:hypothetical protein
LFLTRWIWSTILQMRMFGCDKRYENCRLIFLVMKSHHEHHPPLSSASCDLPLFARSCPDQHPAPPLQHLPDRALSLLMEFLGRNVTSNRPNIFTMRGNSRTLCRSRIAPRNLEISQE